jgi:hypothetical protein
MVKLEAQVGAEVGLQAPVTPLVRVQDYHRHHQKGTEHHDHQKGQEYHHQTGMERPLPLVVLHLREQPQLRHPQQQGIPRAR